MTEQEFEDSMRTEYQFTLTGSMIGYLLTLLAQHQKFLVQEIQEDPTDLYAMLEANANNTVGNHVLHEAHRVLGAGFLAHAMGVPEQEMSNFMTAESPEKIREVAKKIKATQSYSKLN